MTRKNLSRILSQIKINTPPRKLDLIIEVSNIQWNIVKDKDLDICSKLLLEISADAIVIIFSNIDLKKSYFFVFNKISDNIKLSNIINRSKEFNEYFQKYLEYVFEIESSL